MLDYHLHLWEHGPRPLEVTLEQVSAYCAQAAKHGVTEIALTEHLSRFRQADALLGGWWDDDGIDGTPELRAQMKAFWDEDLGAGADLDRYVEVVLAAKAEGLPVVLGLEVDYYETRMDRVASLLAGYPFDVLLGSVHWIGAWGFDNTWGESAFTTLGRAARTRSIGSGTPMTPVAAISTWVGGIRRSSATVLITPSGITPVPVGVSEPITIRCPNPLARALRRMRTDERRLPACTSWSAIEVSSMMRSTPSAGSDVGPPLMWPHTSGARCRRWSGVMGWLPGMLAPPE